MWRILSIVERMGTSLTEASSYLSAALDAIDTEMVYLQRRLREDAVALRAAVDSADVNDEDRRRLLDAIERVESTATRVASFAHPPPDAQAVIDGLSTKTASPRRRPGSPGQVSGQVPGQSQVLPGQSQVLPEPPQSQLMRDMRERP